MCRIVCIYAVFIYDVLCSLLNRYLVPGFMKPTKLMIKDSKGRQVPFEVDGVEWIDGSVQAE